MEWIQTAPHFEITKNGIVITAGEKTDKFITPDGAYVADSAPRVLFEADPDFIFSACVRPTFKTTWDAGALFVEADATHWIKLTFERDDRGRHRVTSTVVQGTSDDCASIEIAGDQTYFRIARKDALVGLYASRNGKFWQPIRTFAFTMKVPLKVGFLAQCPEGGHTQVTFSSIHYEAKRIQNLWGSE